MVLVDSHTEDTITITTAGNTMVGDLITIAAVTMTIAWVVMIGLAAAVGCIVASETMEVELLAVEMSQIPRQPRRLLGTVALALNFLEPVTQAREVAAVVTIMATLVITEGVTWMAVTREVGITVEGNMDPAV